MYEILKPIHQRKLTLYRMRRRVALTKELKCSLIDAFEIQRDEFVNGTSCCQIIIDEANKIIYSLDDKSYLSRDFEYTLNGTYRVLDSNYFSLDGDILYKENELNVLDERFSRNMSKYDNSLDCAYYV